MNTSTSTSDKKKRGDNVRKRERSDEDMLIKFLSGFPVAKYRPKDTQWHEFSERYKNKVCMYLCLYV